jgi:hypothetical protein
MTATITYTERLTLPSANQVMLFRCLRRMAVKRRRRRVVEYRRRMAVKRRRRKVVDYRLPVRVLSRTD